MSYPAGSKVSITYTTDWLGTTTVYVEFDVLTSDNDAYTAMAAELDAQPDITATWTGAVLDVEPVPPATTHSIDGFEVATLPVAGTYRTSTLAYGLDDQLGAVITLGPGTDKGVIAGTTISDGAVSEDGLSEGFGTADLSFLPLAISAADQGANAGWTGNFVGDSVSMLPMDGDAGNDVQPGIGVGDCIMPPLSGQSIGLSGEISTSSLATMNVMLGMGSSETEYSQGISWFSPLAVSASDDPATVASDGVAELAITFSIEAYGHELIPNGAFLRVRNMFQVEACGGAQGKMSFDLTLEASGTGQGVGEFYGEIGYA